MVRWIAIAGLVWVGFEFGCIWQAIRHDMEAEEERKCSSDQTEQ
jgi:hypothetical protein